jgi:hypothetical protein
VLRRTVREESIYSRHALGGNRICAIRGRAMASWHWRELGNPLAHPSLAAPEADPVNRLVKWWQALWTNTETLLLRAENKRLKETNLALEEDCISLRKDNRALVNAQLKQAGIVTLPELAEEKPQPIQRMRRLSLHQRQRQYAMATDPRRIAEEAKDAQS